MANYANRFLPATALTNILDSSHHTINFLLYFPVQKTTFVNQKKICKIIINFNQAVKASMIMDLISYYYN